MTVTVCVWERMSVACFNSPGSIRNAPISYMDKMPGKAANDFSQPTNACCLVEGQQPLHNCSCQRANTLPESNTEKNNQLVKEEREVDL